MPKKQTRKRSRGNGEGSIYYSESKKKWIAQYTIGRDIDGKQRRKTFYADTRKGVKNKLEEFIKGNCPEKRTNLTICEIIRNSYEYKLKTNLISENTYGRAIETTKRIEKHRIGTMPIKSVSFVEIQDFFYSLTNYSNSVIKKIYGQLNYAFEYCVNNDILVRNPLKDKTRLPMPKSSKPTKKVSALTLDEQKHLVDVLKEHPNTNLKAQILISLYSGMRMGEINALLVSDIDMTARTVNVNKTLTRDINYKTVVGQSTKTYAGIRTIKMTDSLYEVFEDFFNNVYSADSDILFPARNGGYISTSSVNSQLKRICQKYNIVDNINAHALRHTFATRAIEAGVSAKALQKILGHADITVTLNTYCDVFDKFEDENNCRLNDYLERQGLFF